MSNYFQCAPGLFFTLRREADGRMSLPFVGGRLSLLQGLTPDRVARDIAPLLALCAAEDVSLLLAELERSGREMMPCQLEVRLGDPVKGLTVVELSAMPEPMDGEPGVIEWDGFLHDVTAQRTETRLREQIESVAQAVPGFLYTTHIDADGVSTFPFVSDGIEALCGLNPCDIRDDASPLRARYHPDDLPGLFERIADAGRTLTPFRYEARIFHPQQGMRWIEIRSTLHRTANGEVDAHGLMLDITERKLAERTLQEQYSTIAELNDQLEENARRLEEHAVELEAAYEQLKATEAWYRGVIHSSPDGMLVIDQRGIVVLANVALCRMFGYADHEVVGQSIDLLVPKNLRESHEHKRLAFARGPLRKKPSHAIPDLRAQRKDGSVFDADVTLSALPENDFSEDAICVAIRDVSERRIAEERLRQALNFSEGVINAIPDFLLEVDRHGRYLNAWSNTPTVAESRKKARLGKRVQDVLGPEAGERAMAAIREADVNGSSFGLTLCIPNQNGEPRWYEYSLAKKHGTTMEDDTFIVLSRDITPRVQAETALSASEARAHARSNLLNTIIDSSPDIVVFALDRTYRYLAFNGKHRDVMGTTWGADIQIGMSMLESIGAQDDREKARRHFDRALSGERFTGESVSRDAGPAHDYWQVFWSPIHADTGEIIGLTCIALNVSERRRMEGELQRREQYLRTLLDNFPFFVWLKDEQSRLLAANVEYARVARAASPLELEGKTDFDLFPQDLAEKYVADDRAVMASGVPKHAEASYTDEHGQRLWMETWKSPLVMNGRTIGTVGFSRDITGRKETELRLAETHQHLSSVLKTIPDLVWMKDVDGVYLACNHAFERFFGAKEADIVGKTDYDFVNKDLADFFRQKDRAALEADRVCINEEWVTYADSGQQGLLETRKVPVQGSNGSVIGILGVARDITERKHIESALAISERKFRTLVENTPDTVVRFGRDLRRSFVNPALASFLGKDADELLGKKTSEFPAGPSGDLAEEKLIAVFATAQPLEFEYVWHDKNGDEICSLMRMTPEFNDTGEVESVLAVGRDITELNAFRYKIHKMAFYDTLTDLPNRALFNDRLRQMIADASWHGQTAGLMMIDMDRFKTVNDTMGHAVGDELLREAARRLSQCVRSYDTVARLGGDEFAVILPDVRTGADLGRIAGKILEKFDDRFLLDGKDIFVSCSIGIALYPDDSRNEQDLLKFADSAMYFAKRSGRNNFRFYAKDLTTTAQARLTLEQDLRHAVQRGELELHYQPKVSLKDGSLIGSEALLRWHHPQNGMISPCEFIQIAEDTGLIVEIGEWVMAEACRVAAAWNGDERAEHKVAINLSPRQFQSPRLIDSLRRALEEAGCRPQWIELEITESLLLDEDGQILDVLRTFRNMGISIAIDDFGTGYSSLSYLARFPIDTLKIDRSFISTVTTDHYRAELVRAILSIARCLGQEVVAEGVETIEQADFLFAHGCQTAQGFLFSKAVPEAEFALLPRRFINAPSA